MGDVVRHARQRGICTHTVCGQVIGTIHRNLSRPVRAGGAIHVTWKLEYPDNSTSSARYLTLGQARRALLKSHDCPGQKGESMKNSEWDALVERFRNRFPDVFLHSSHPGDSHRYVFQDMVFVGNTIRSGRIQAAAYMAKYAAEHGGWGDE